MPSNWSFGIATAVGVMMCSQARAVDGYSVGNTMPAFTATDIFGDSFSTAELSGKWVLIDFCAPWCFPCTVMAPDAVRVSDAFNRAGVPFVYVQAMATNQTNDGPSAQASADYWSSTYDVPWPVRILHNGGVAGSPMIQAFNNFGFNAFPSLVLLSPSGVITDKHVGELFTNDFVAYLAQKIGVATPTLPGAAVMPASSRRTSLHSSNMTWTIGAASSSAESVFIDRELDYFFPVGGAPLIEPFGQLYKDLNTETGVERWAFFASAENSGIPLPLNDAMTFEFSNLEWTAGCEEFIGPTSATLLALDGNDFVSLSSPDVAVGFSKGVLSVGPFTLAGAGPANPNIVAIGVDFFDAFSVSEDLSAKLHTLVVNEGENGQWSVTIPDDGEGTLSYLWDREGVPVANGNGIDGFDQATLSLTNAQEALEGYYGVSVTDGCRTVHSGYKRLGIRPAICAADIAPNGGDGIVNIIDLTQVILNWGTNNATADIDHNGIVNISDLTVIILAWGTCG